MTSLATTLKNDTNIQALPADQVTEYVKQRLNAVRAQLLEVTVTRACVEVSVDVPESSRDAQLEQFDKQIESLQNVTAVLSGALPADAVAPAPAE